MSAVEILRTLIASYLITTLGATALAKLKNRPVASAGMLREGVVPAKSLQRSSSQWPSQSSCWQHF